VDAPAVTRAIVKEILKRLRVGAVPYLNVKPLIAGMEEMGVGLRFAVPSQLPDLLERGEVDVALLPSIEYLRGRPFFVVPGISIASRGAVESVLLFLQVPSVREIKRVALDESSLTSATLVRILLKEKYGLKPSEVEYIPWSPGEGTDSAQADAILVIGDNAMKMRCDLDEKGLTLDLGAEWRALTGLPFVYALWVTAREELIDTAGRLLHEAKRRGVESLEAIANKEARRLGLGVEFCFRYLSENIHYDLGEAEIEGLRRFYHYALSMGLASEGVKLDFRSRSYTREGTLQVAGPLPPTDRI
jgi:chorismate dehydratase